MSIFKSLLKWEADANASVATDQELIELQTKRIRLLFESLMKRGFTEDQAVRIVSGICVKTTNL